MGFISEGFHRDTFPAVNVRRVCSGRATRAQQQAAAAMFLEETLFCCPLPSLASSYLLTPFSVVVAVACVVVDVV